MRTPDAHTDPLRDASREEIMGALFAHMVMQNTDMALMFLGQTPNPETGETVRDIQAARIFIDQLEMLEFKTKGNLSREEEKLLAQSLTHLRLSFVDAVENPPKAGAAPKAVTSAQPAVEPPLPGGADNDESRKKFSKKY